MAERKKKSDALFKEKMKKSPYHRLQVAHKRINELEDILGRMLYVFDRGLNDGTTGRKLCDKARKIRDAGGP